MQLILGTIGWHIIGLGIIIACSWYFIVNAGITPWWLWPINIMCILMLDIIFGFITYKAIRRIEYKADVAATFERLRNG